MKNAGITALILTFVMIISMLSDITIAYANDGTCGVLTYTVSDGEITIKSCNTNAVDVEIPSEIELLPVKHIVQRAFNQCTQLERVVIPDSVETLGEVYISDYCCYR